MEKLGFKGAHKKAVVKVNSRKLWKTHLGTHSGENSLPVAGVPGLGLQWLLAGGKLPTGEQPTSASFCLLGDFQV